MTLRRNYTHTLIKLLKTEEEIIIRYMLKLHARGNLPRLTTVKDIANSLLAKRLLTSLSANLSLKLSLTESTTIREPYTKILSILEASSS
jgi:hypothetical protein